ncbi:MAG: twin-arginine translocation signal domain-containing protein, partial [Acidobacteriaceae bacterium]
MSTSRRDFLKSTLIAGAGAVLPSSNATAAIAESKAALPGSQAAEPMGGPGPGQGYTRGLGIYPGAPEEDFSPTLVIDKSTYRNLALMRPAYHSSSYDYNLTAQLVTDGMKDTKLPDWIGVTINPFQTLQINERQIVVDHFNAAMLPLTGPTPSVQIQIGGEAAPAVDRIEVFVALPHQLPASDLKCGVSVSDDGRVWREMGSATTPKAVSPAQFPPDLVRFSSLYNPSIALKEVCRSRYYKVDLSAPLLPEMSMFSSLWQIGQVGF